MRKSKDIAIYRRVREMKGGVKIYGIEERARGCADKKY